MLIDEIATTTNIHRRALGPGVDRLPRQFWALLDYCGMNDRICPAPKAWLRMWQLLDAVATDRRPPRPPAADEPGNSLKWALVDHLLWADQLGVFGKVDQFLRGLASDQWMVKDQSEG
jgi:hypothetical protein